MTSKTVTLLFVCAVAIAGLLGPGQRSSSGQQENVRKQPACTIFCGDGTFNTLNLGAKPCWGGPLPAGEAGDHFKNVAEEDQAAICRNLTNAGRKNTECPSFKTLAALCKEKEKSGGQPPSKNKCEPPPPENNNPPWLNKDLPCDNRQRATISWSQSRASNMDVSFTVDICGEVIRYISPGGGSPERTPPGVRSFDVCCDSWRNAANTGSPCDARRDIDCDGTLNESDQMPEYAFRDRRPDDFVSNSPLSNMPFWKRLHEPVQTGCKDCKWELVRVEYTCKNVADPVRSARRAGMVFDATYNYQATWKCPSSGQTQETRDTVTMVDLRCPTPPNRSWP